MTENTLRKGDRTRQKILQAALYCLAHYGERETTFQKIADHCGVSQPLVVRYFKSRENIFPLVLEDFLNRARDKTASALKQNISPIEKIRNYLEVSVALFRDEPEWGRMYLMLFYFSGFNDQYRSKNSEIKQIAVNRVAEILREGVEKGDLAVTNVDLTAKLIHIALSGLVLNMLTEKLVYPDSILVKALQEMIASHIKKSKKKKS